MGQQLKALIVIISLSMPLFWLARRQIIEFATDAGDFDRRRNAWIALTMLVFLANDFWIYVVGAIIILGFSAIRETNKLAMFLALLMVIPPLSKIVPGFAGIAVIFDVNHVRTLSVVLLLPAWLSLRRDSGVIPFGRSIADKLLLGYIIEPLILQGAVDSITNTVRYGLYSFVDTFLPYYVASRGLRDLKAYRDVLVSFAFAVLLMTPLAVFEYARHWLLYSEVANALNVSDSMTSYMLRSDRLRVVVASGHSIILGYVVMISLGCLPFVRAAFSSRWSYFSAFGLLAFTLVATGARGPWIASISVALVLLALGRSPAKQLTRASIAFILLVVVMSMTTTGKDIIDSLPFIGTANTDSVDYRQRVFDISILVIKQNLWLGSFAYMTNPLMQQLIQGEGIIDIVNSYLGVALTYGMIGLSLFCGIFSVGLWNVAKIMRGLSKDDDVYLLGRSLVAILIGILIVIATLSSIGVVPILYWIVAGLCEGYRRLASSKDLQASDHASLPRAAPQRPHVQFRNA